MDPRRQVKSDRFDGITVETDHLLQLRHLIGAGEAGVGARTMMLPGGIVTRRRGRGLETDDIRPYAYGDDVRHIDRNTTARTGQLHVRTFRDERERSVLLVADFRPSMLFGTRRCLRSVACAEALTLAGWRVAGQGGRVGVLAGGGRETFFHRPGAGDRAMKAVTGRLAAAHVAALAAETAEDPPLSALIEAGTRTLPHDGTMLIATGLDHPGADFDTVMRDLVHRAAVDVLLIADRFELNAPVGIYPYRTADGRAGTGAVGGRTPRGGDITERSRRLKRLGARVLVVDAALEPLELAALIEDFDARRR